MAADTPFGPGFFDGAAALLEYGFLGLSVILVGMSFSLYRSAFRERDPAHRQENRKAATQYFVFSFVFMIGAGVLKMAEKHFYPESNIFVAIEPLGNKEKAYGQEYKDPYTIDVEGKQIVITDRAPIPATVREGAKLTCAFYPLKSKIEELEKQLIDRLISSSTKNDTGFTKDEI